METVFVCFYCTIVCTHFFVSLVQGDTAEQTEHSFCRARKRGDKFTFTHKLVWTVWT